MAISTYATLVSALERAIIRADLTLLIPDWIALFESGINTQLKRREMTVRATSSTVADQQAYALPSDFGDPVSLHITTGTDTVLTPSTWDRLLSFQETGRPVEYALVANEFRLGPIPDGVYVMDLYYFKVVPALTAIATTNWLLTSYPDLYFYGALVEAAAGRLADDPSAAKWAMRYAEALKGLKRDTARENSFGGGPLLRVDPVLSGGGRYSILTDS
jgi:hypothetical protein